MEEIDLRKILKTYKMFSKRQNEILGNLIKTREIFTFDDLQKELQEDVEAKELLKKIRSIVNGQYKKANLLYDEEPNQLDILYNAIESIKQEINERINESNNVSEEILEEYKKEYMERSEPYRKRIEEILKN